MKISMNEALRRVRRSARASGSAALGFTLFELLVAVAIIGVLAAIALPAYDSYALKSRRTLAKTALLDFAAREEKYFSMNNVYADVSSTTSCAKSNTADNVFCKLGYPSGTYSSGIYSITGSDATVYYSLTVTPTTAGTTTFTATATPTSASGQNKDACGTYTLNNLGQQTPTSSGCW